MSNRTEQRLLKGTETILSLDAESDLRNLSVKVLTIQDEERRRFARDLHDGVGQTLTDGQSGCRYQKSAQWHGSHGKSYRSKFLKTVKKFDN